MKRSVQVLAALWVLLVASSAMAQTSATANANATVIPQISITKSADLEFGNIIAGTGGTAVVSTGGARSFTGGVTGASGITVTAAQFGLTGASGLGWQLTSPPTSITLNGPSSSTMSCALNYSATTGTLTGGTATVNVGGTLTVASGQTTGLYTTTFTVVAAYQ